MKKLSFALLVFSLNTTIQATNYYVSTFGTSTNDGLTSLTPFPTIQKAANLTVAGDTVFIMSASTYNVTATALNITRSGAPNRYITYKAFPGSNPKIKVTGNVWNALVVNANYIVVEGLELEGNNANITYAAALESFNQAAAGGTNWSYYSAFNTNGITVGGPNAESLFPHHVVIRNCKIHNFPGGGLNSIQADYTTFEGNTIYNNAWYMMYAGSGISILSPFNSDTITTGYKNIVRNNYCHTNKTTIPWISTNPRVLSDGNGIIIDVNIRPYSGTGPAYIGRTLVENNVSVNNGGSGIHSFKADHVDIINNTAYNNGTVVNYPEIFSNQCNDVNLINNIMYARTGADCNSNPRNPTTEIYANNLYFNGNVKKMGANDVVADPKFVNLSLDFALGNFRLQPTSPAINTGSNIAGQYSLKDILGVSRPQGAKPDKGAYEYTVGTGVATLPFQDETSVFPNPAKETLFVRLPPQLSDIHVEIFNNNGVLIQSQIGTNSSTPIDVRQLPQGIYSLIIYQKKQAVAVHRFVKL